MIIYALGSCVSPECRQKVNPCLQLLHTPWPGSTINNDPSAAGLEDFIIWHTSSPGHSFLAFSSVRCTQTICILNNSEHQCLKIDLAPCMSSGAAAQHLSSHGKARARNVRLAVAAGNKSCTDYWFSSRTARQAHPLDHKKLNCRTI